MEALFHLRDFGYEQLTELTLDTLRQAGYDPMVVPD